MLTLILRGIHSNKWNTKSRKTEKKRKQINITICFIFFNIATTTTKQRKKREEKQSYPSGVSSLILALLAHVPRDFTSESTPTQDAGRAPTLISSLRRCDDKACNTRATFQHLTYWWALKSPQNPCGLLDGYHELITTNAVLSASLAHSAPSGQRTKSSY